MIWIVIPMCAVGGVAVGLAIGHMSCARVDQIDAWRR